ncbi:MAG: carbohydrate kinase family protein [Anaerolineae bacterium]|nr:carbohydrate kinase family protein [Anaerolineae bacterium]
MAEFDAVAAGHVCLDVIPQMPPGDLLSILVPGAVAEIGPVMLSTGGPVSNTGRNLHRLGIRTRLMGKVGNDAFGAIIRDLIRQDDPALADDMIVAPGETSSYTIVISPPGTDRFFMHCGGANHTFGADDVPYDRLRNARLFHFGYPPYMARMYANTGAELEDLYRRAKATGVITSLDMALPDPNGPSGRVDWARVLARTLPHVDLFLPSLDELVYMLRRDAAPISEQPDTLISEIAAQALNLGAGVVVLKLGDRGLYLRTGPDGAPHTDDPGWRNRELWAPCFQPEPLVGTTGSGDATIAGFLAAVLRDQPVEAALTSAVAVGACNVEAADALSGVRSWDETMTRIQAGWERQPVIINAPGWTWDAASRLWVGPHDNT